MASPTFPTNSAQSAVAQIQDALRLAHAGRIAEGAARLRGLLAHEPAHAAASCLLAVLLQQLGDNVGALEALDRATTLAPDDATVHETRAGTLLALGRAADAEHAARAALAID